VQQQQKSQKLWQLGAVVLVVPIFTAFDASSQFLGAAWWHILASIASVKGSLSAADLASVDAVLQLSRAGITTGVISFLSHQQGSSLSELAQLDFKNPWQVLGRGVLTAGVAVGGVYALEAAVNHLAISTPALANAPAGSWLSAYMQAGDPAAIGIYSAVAVIVAPAYEELLFRWAAGWKWTWLSLTLLLSQ
jgi:hypothetical protein